MSVYESRYRPLREEKVERAFMDNAKIMTRFEIGKSISGKWSKIPLIFAAFFLFIALTSLPALLIVPEDDFVTNLEFFSSFFLTPREGPGSLIWLHVAIINSGLIATDLGDNTFNLYLTKMKLKTYFISKVIASIVLTFLGLPLVAFAYFIVAIYKRGLPIFPFNWNLIGQYFVILSKLVLFTIFIVFLYSSVILLFSAYTKKSINAGVLFIVYLIASSVIFDGILYDTTGFEPFRLLSPLTSMYIVFTNFFTREVISTGQFPTLEKESPDLVPYAVGMVILYALLSLFLTYKRLQFLRRD